MASFFTKSFSDVLLKGRLRPYLDILVVGSGARIFGLASQFVVLIMLSRFLPKDSFGDLMTAFGFYRLAGVALGVGGSLVLLFHVSRRLDDYQTEIRLQRFSALMGAVPSTAIAVLAIFAAQSVASAPRQTFAGHLAATARSVFDLHNFAHHRDWSVGGTLADCRIDLLG